MTRVITYVEMDIDFCTLTYGVSPCTAELGVTGDVKCYNTLKTCQDRTQFDNDPVTLRFGYTAGGDNDIECIPSLLSVAFSPVTISFGEDLGQRGSLTVQFRDHKHSDTGEGFDRYRTERDYDPWEQGSFWGRFRARQPYLRGRPIRLLRGVVGETIAEMSTRHYLIEDFDGPNAQGVYTIVAKDVLKLADGDRAQAPVISEGYLTAECAIDAATFTIGPSGAGDAQYPASGYCAVGGKEIMYFTRASDTFTITRAQYNTDAAAHDAEDRVQLCLIYDAEDPADIIYDLLVNYANVPADYIDLGTWQTETSSYLQRLYSANIADPVSVKTLVAEIIKQAALAIWWDDVNQKIKLRVLRSIVTTETFTVDNVLEGSLSIKEQPSKRKTEIWTYYGQRNPLLAVDEPNNYRSVLATVDLQMETDYGASTIEKIFARWIPAFGLQVAERVNNIQLGRYKSPPRAISFASWRFGDITPELGEGYNIESWQLQDAAGAAETVQVQVVRLNATDDRYTMECEEALYGSVTAGDLVDRVIIIDTNINNFNLRTVHDSIYPTPEAGESPPITVTCYVSTGVVVGSTDPETPAFDVGSWPAGIPLTVVIRGRIQGKGGNGGDGGIVQGAAGENGSTAFYTRTDLDVDIDGGEILAGGGGGGGGTGFVILGAIPASGGGGGQGQIPGTGGAGEDYDGSPAEAGHAGTKDAPGDGGRLGAPGGDGGAAGEDGADGVGFGAGGGAGGNAGHAVDGVSFVNWTGTHGAEIVGTQVN